MTGWTPTRDYARHVDATLQVTAPPHEPAHGASQGAFPSGNQLESSLHFQGAVAVEGEATLWRASADGSAWPQKRRTLTDSFEGDLQVRSFFPGCCRALCKSQGVAARAMPCLDLRRGFAFLLERSGVAVGLHRASSRLEIVSVQK